MKIRSDNLAFKVQNSNKNLPISVLRTEPEYKREVLSIRLHFEQTVRCGEGSPAPPTPFPNVLHPPILTNQIAPFIGKRLFFACI